MASSDTLIKLCVSLSDILDWGKRKLQISLATLFEKVLLPRATEATGRAQEIGNFLRHSF